MWDSSDNIYFLINNNFHILDLSGPCQVFHEANQIDRRFELHYIAFSNLVESYQGLNISNVVDPPEIIPPKSIVIVCASKYDSELFTDENSKKSICWLQKIAPLDITIAGICTGAFLLAKAGLLNNQQCTTHHRYTEELGTRYPLLRVLKDRIYVKSDNIYTSAGVTAGIDLCLELISDLIDKKCSVTIARDLVVSRRRMANDSQLSEHFSHRNHVSPMIHSIQDYISKTFTEKITYSLLCKKFNISLRHLQRLFYDVTGTTIKKYITELRLEEAKSLIGNNKTIDQAAFLSGFSTPSSLRSAWKKKYGYLPSSYLK